MTMFESLQETLKSQSKPVTAKDLSSASGIPYSQVASYMTTLFNRKLIKRAIDPNGKRKSYLYATPDFDAPGFELIGRRRSYACKTRKAAGVTRQKSPAMKQRPTIAIPAGSKIINLTIPEARSLYAELGEMFSGGLARSTK